MLILFYRRRKGPYTELSPIVFFAFWDAIGHPMNGTGKNKNKMNRFKQTKKIELMNKNKFETKTRKIEKIFRRR